MTHLVKLQKRNFKICCSNIQEYRYMTECIFNTIYNIVMNTVKYGLHVFKVVKVDLADLYLNTYIYLHSINEPELPTNFGEFCRRMGTKWEQKSLAIYQCFHPNLIAYHQIVTRHLSFEVFKIVKEQLRYSNLSKSGWEEIRPLAGDRR